MSEEQRPGGLVAWFADIDNLAYFVSVVAVIFFVIALIMGYGFGL